MNQGHDYEARVLLSLSPKSISPEKTISVIGFRRWSLRPPVTIVAEWVMVGCFKFGEGCSVEVEGCCERRAARLMGPSMERKLIIVVDVGCCNEAR
ncbi:hypothetical protein V6N12_009415 [Hibiscus sabdariffa]|uniref:Uncharacterized protein n=1 Tax=Hibiscus sabdariffa TaxID=183260 RepID=A0ABR2E939_9ROSI